MKRYPNEIKILVALLDQFHLLPSAKPEVLPKLVENVLLLEYILSSCWSYGGCYSSGSVSPFRKPLYKFLNKNPAESLRKFLEPRVLANRDWSQLFLSVLKSSQGEEIAQYLIKYPEQLVSQTLDVDRMLHSGSQIQLSVNEKAELELQGIKIVNVLSEINPRWFASSRIVMLKLLTIFEMRFCNIRVQNEENLPLEQVSEPYLIVKCILRFLRENRAEAIVIWTSLHCFINKTLIDYSFLANYFRRDVPRIYTAAEKRFLIQNLLPRLFEVSCHLNFILTIS
jgi:transformation/transcription domain-associated protein